MSHRLHFNIVHELNCPTQNFMASRLVRWHGRVILYHVNHAADCVWTSCKARLLRSLRTLGSMSSDHEIFQRVITLSHREANVPKTPLLQWCCSPASAMSSCIWYCSNVRLLGSTPLDLFWFMCWLLVFTTHIIFRICGDMWQICVPVSCLRLNSDFSKSTLV